MSVDTGHPTERLTRPASGRLLRLRVLLGRKRLDARLAANEAPERDAALARRAAQLCSPRARGLVAHGLERALREDGRRGLSAAVPVNRQAVEAARPYVAQLVEVLRSTAPVAPCGVVRARRLLTDGASPLYRPASSSQLRDAAGQALRSLDPAGALDAEPTHAAA